MPPRHRRPVALEKMPEASVLVLRFRPGDLLRGGLHGTPPAVRSSKHRAFWQGATPQAGRGPVAPSPGPSVPMVPNRHVPAFAACESAAGRFGRGFRLAMMHLARWLHSV